MLFKIGRGPGSAGEGLARGKGCICRHSKLCCQLRRRLESHARGFSKLKFKGRVESLVLSLSVP